MGICWQFYCRRYPPCRMDTIPLTPLTLFHEKTITAGVHEEVREADGELGTGDCPSQAAAQNAAAEHGAAEATAQACGTLHGAEHEHIRLLLQQEQPLPADVEEHMREAQARMPAFDDPRQCTKHRATLDAKTPCCRRGGCLSRSRTQLPGLQGRRGTLSRAAGCSLAAALAAYGAASCVAASCAAAS